MEEAFVLLLLLLLVVVVVLSLVCFFVHLLLLLLCSCFIWFIVGLQWARCSTRWTCWLMKIPFTLYSVAFLLIHCVHWLSSPWLMARLEARAMVEISTLFITRFIESLLLFPVLLFLVSLSSSPSRTYNFFFLMASTLSSHIKLHYLPTQHKQGKR